MRRSCPWRRPEALALCRHRPVVPRRRQFLYEVRYALARALKQTGRGDEAARELGLFERAPPETTEDRRRTMAAEAHREEETRQDHPR